VDKQFPPSSGLKFVGSDIGSIMQAGNKGCGGGIGFVGTSIARLFAPAGGQQARRTRAREATEPGGSTDLRREGGPYQGHIVFKAKDGTVPSRRRWTRPHCVTSRETSIWRVIGVTSSQLTYRVSWR
jgi:hypothetical protein